MLRGGGLHAQAPPGPSAHLSMAGSSRPSSSLPLSPGITWGWLEMEAQGARSAHCQCSGALDAESHCGCRC